MKTLIQKKAAQVLTIITSSLLLMNTAYAHEASEHKQQNIEMPKCEAIHNMDKSKMDINDPIMLAMMKQCMGKTHQNEASPVKK